MEQWYIAVHYSMFNKQYSLFLLCAQELSQTEYCTWREWLSIPASEPDQRDEDRGDGPRWRALVQRGRRLQDAGGGRCAKNVKSDWDAELFSNARLRMRYEDALEPEDFAVGHAILARNDSYCPRCGCANNVWLHVQSAAFTLT